MHNLVQDVGYIPLPSSEYDNESQKLLNFAVVILRVSWWQNRTTDVVRFAFFKKMSKRKVKLIEFVLKSASLITILTTIGILWVLLSESYYFFKEASIIESLLILNGLLYL